MIFKLKKWLFKHPHRAMTLFIITVILMVIIFLTMLFRLSNTFFNYLSTMNMNQESLYQLEEKKRINNIKRKITVLEQKIALMNSPDGRQINPFIAEDVINNTLKAQNVELTSMHSVSSEPLLYRKYEIRCSGSFFNLWQTIMHFERRRNCQIYDVQFLKRNDESYIDARLKIKINEVTYK